MQKNSIRISSILFLSLLFVLTFAVQGKEKGNNNLPTSREIQRESAHPKLQTVLQIMANKSTKSIPQVEEFATNKGIQLEENMVTVILEPESGRSSSVNHRELKSFDAEIEATSRSLIRASVPPGRLTDIASHVSGVDFIRLPRRPQGAKVDTSEGVVKTDANEYHDAGVLGQGTKVAIIDLGFDHLTEAKESGDLPSEIIEYENDYTSDGDIELGGNHGTDVAELVHDMAPESKLYLMKIGDELDLQNAKDDAIEMGIDVINHSVGWFNFAYYDGTGFISGVAANARNNGVLWVNAAGNAARSHWKGEFYDPDGDDYHNFSGTDERNSLGTLSSGYRVDIYMTWNAWPDDAEDYDLHLFNSQGTRVASSANIQSGTQDPAESLTYFVSNTDQYSFGIYNVDAPGTPEVEVFAFYDNNSPPNLEYMKERSSILDPGNEQKVMTVGAISQENWTEGPQEPFSSQGPTNNSKFAAARIKPDIMGPDEVSTSGYGTFFGTSASSPHVAGAAALLLSATPSRTADDLEEILTSDAIDMGVSGEDNIYGFGRLEMGVDSTPPALITDFYATENESNESSLSWMNPEGADLGKVIVKRKTGSYPVNSEDGTTVYSNSSPEAGNVVKHPDSGLNNGTTYYYAVFSRDNFGNWNETVSIGDNADQGKPSYSSLTKGWTIISPPGVAVSPDPADSIKDDIDPLTLYYEYSSDSGYTVYPDETMDTKMDWKKGYWVRVNQDLPIDIGTNPPSGEVKIELVEEGWHLIGVPFPVDWSQVDFSDPQAFSNNRGDVRLVSWSPEEELYYNRYSNQSYVLSPWRGYWLFVKSASTNDPAELYLTETDQSPSPAERRSYLPGSIDSEDLNYPPSPPEDAEKPLAYHVTASPNPLTSDGKIQFKVEGAVETVEGLKVTVFDPNGGAQWSDVSVTRHLTWKVDNLPNGLYLYKASVRLDGQWKKPVLNKLLVVS